MIPIVGCHLVSEEPADNPGKREVRTSKKGMQVILGVDPDGTYSQASDLLSRLGFPTLNVELLYVDDPVRAAGIGAGAYGYIYSAEIESQFRQEGDEALKTAHAGLGRRGIDSLSLYLIGQTTKTLAERADETHAQLIAIGSSHKSKYGAFFVGSVGRALTISAHQSILIAKHHVSHEGPLTVVFATDCSEYADECLRMFVRMRPQGVGRVVVVSAVEQGSDPTYTKSLEDHIDSLVRHLTMESFDAEGHVVVGSPTEVIDAMMKDRHADLLALGARGHGLFERILVGSVSLHEVIATPHSVLLLRLAN